MSKSPKPIPQHERGVAAIADLVPAPYNPRKIDKASKKALAASLQRFGVVQDVVVNRRTMHVVGGHQRLEALKDAGQTDVHVVWVDLDDKDEKALNVALNSSHVSGTFDDEKLAAILTELQPLPGFDDLRLDALLKDIELPAPDDGEPAGDKPPRTPSGKKVISLNDEQWRIFAKALAHLAAGGPLEQGEAVAELAERYLASVKGKAA